MRPQEYKVFVDDYNHALTKTSLRFAKEKAYTGQIVIKPKRHRLLRCKKRRGLNDGSIKDFLDMTDREKKERLAYLRYRMRVIAHAALFLHLLRRISDAADERRLHAYRNKIYIDEDN